MSIKGDSRASTIAMRFAAQPYLDTRVDAMHGHNLSGIPVLESGRSGTCAWQVIGAVPLTALGADPSPVFVTSHRFKSPSRRIRAAMYGRPSRSAPVFSIVLPTYNRPEMLRRAISSVCRQTFRDFELIVVDDGSTTSCLSAFRIPEMHGFGWLEAPATLA